MNLSDVKKYLDKKVKVVVYNKSVYYGEVSDIVGNININNSFIVLHSDLFEFYKIKINEIVSIENVEETYNVRGQSCSSCGEKGFFIDITNNNVVCVNCKKSTKNDMKDVHICFDSANKSAFSQSIFSFYKKTKKNYIKNIDYKIYDYELDLDKPKYALRTISNNKIVNKDTELFEEINSFDLEKINIYLWYNLKNANSILNFLLFSSVLSYFKNVYEVKFNESEEDKNDNFTIDNCLKKAKKINEEDYKNFKELYNSIRKEDYWYYVVKDKKVVGYPECFFDDIILNLLSDQFKDGFVIMEEFTSLTKEKYGYVNYFMFKSIIDRLCKKGLVEPSEKYDVFFVPNLIKFKKAKQTQIKYLDALNELSFALEDGSTYGLYRLLSEDAEFYSCSTEKRLNGRDEIIDYIEQKALLRWEKEEVSPCRCYKYEDEEINYYEDVKLYLYYPKDNCLDEIEWVFEDGKFNKILIKPCPLDKKCLKQYNPFKLRLKKKN